VRPRFHESLKVLALALALCAPAGCRLDYDWQPTDLGDGGAGDGDLADYDAATPADAAIFGNDATSGNPDATPLPPDAMPPPPDAMPPPPPDASTGCTTGCPTGIALVDPNATPQYGGTGGTGFAESCPTGQVITGYDGATEPNFGALGSIRASCGTPRITAGTLAVTIVPAGTLTRRGSVTSPAWTRKCPANMMIIGYSGRSGVLVDQLSFVCAPLVISGAPGSFSIGYGAQTTLAAIGDSGGSAFGPLICASGRVATGDSGRAGSFVDAFAMLCSRPQLTF
jgi:hypothetical protein